MRERITNAVARTLTLLAIADAWEGEERDSFNFPSDFQGAGPGEDWDDVIPEHKPPSEALSVARLIVERTQVLNKGRSIEDIGSDWDTACAADDDHGAEFEWSDEGPERFGHCLAMQALGHGVSLDDDVPHGRAYERPVTGHHEFYAWDFDVGAWLDQREVPPQCGHSTCSQHFIDTGSSECVEQG